MKNLSVKLNKRRFKHGSFATIVTIGFIALVVLLNVASSIVFEMYPLSIDLTSDSRFSISDKSKDAISDLGENVKFVVFAEETSFQNANQYYKQAYEILKDYQKTNNKQISIEFIDTVKNPNAAQAYPDLSIEDGDIVIASSLRHRKITASDLFEVQTTEYNETKYFSNAEQTLTNAILYVTDSDPKTAIVLNVPTNVSLTGLSDMLKSNNYTIKTQTLQTEDLDAEADLVLFPQPSSELSYETIKKLSDYLDNNAQFGKNLIFVPDNVTPIDETLANFLKDWGIKVDDSIIYETTTSNYSISPNQVSMTISDETFKNKMNSSLLIISGNTRPITPLFEEDSNRGTTVIMASSETAVTKPFTAGDNFKLDAQTKASYNAAVKGYRFRYNTDGTKIYSNVLAIGSADMLSSSWLAQAGFGNGKFAITSANYLTQNENTFTAIAVDMTSEVLSITADQVNIYRAVLLIIIPLLLLVGGFVVWMRRRHL